jgi:Ser-tRNA(Ala) deacylase AlaX
VRTLTADPVKMVEEKNSIYIALDQTVFHPRSGRRPSDKGTITGSSFRVDVKRVALLDETVVQRGSREDLRLARLDVRSIGRADCCL